MQDNIVTQEIVDAYFQKINASLGNSLTLMEPESGIVGRDAELRELSIILKRRDTPVALLLGPAGTGKSALAGAWQAQQESMKGKHIEMYELNVGLMADGGTQVLMTRMNRLLATMKEYSDKLKELKPDSEVILFIDEVHLVVSVFGEGSKVGGDLLKATLARAEKYIKIVTATTNDEYDRYIASDPPLARRFKPLRLQEVSGDTVKLILRNWLRKKSLEGENFEDLVTDELLELIINSNKLYRADAHEPAASIDALATALATHEEDGVPFDKRLITKVFRMQYKVNLDFSVDVRHTIETLHRRIKGQPIALYAMESMVRRLSFQFRPSPRPKATAIFAGTTGVGKSLQYWELVPIRKSDGTLGWKHHGELEVGDYVFNRKGEPVKVIGNYPQGRLHAYRVHFRNGASVICNDEHLWTYHYDGEWQTETLRTMMDKGLATGKDAHGETFSIPRRGDAKTPDISQSQDILYVEDLGCEVEMNCIMVDDPEHLYCVTRDFIVTHNTEMVKALAEAIYEDDTNFINISMTDYAGEGSDPRFRRTLGAAVSHSPDTIILLDELEKAHDEVLATLLPALDEGIIKYNNKTVDGYEAEFTVSLKNSIVIATSNAGADAFETIAKYDRAKAKGSEMTQAMESKAARVESEVVSALESEGLRPEFVQRFNTIVAFDTLSEHTLIEIANGSLLKLLMELYENKGIDVRIPPMRDWTAAGYPVTADEITMFIVYDKMNLSKASQANARRIRNIIDKDIVDPILKAIAEHPDATKFNMRTDGNCQFQNPESAESGGKIIVEAMG